MANLAFLPIAVRVSRVSALLDCSHRHVDHLVERGALRTVHLSGDTELRVPLSDIYAALGLQPPTELGESRMWDRRCRACPAEGSVACPPMDLVALVAEIRAERAGQRNALIITLASLLASVVLGLAGETVVAGSLGGATIVALSRVFVAGRYGAVQSASE